MPDTRYAGLIRRRTFWVPTWRGGLVLLVLMAVLLVAVIRGIHPFLALQDPVPGGVLVVEGWGADYVLAAAAAEFNRGQYEAVYVTGVPLEHGAVLTEYKTYADVGAAVLLKSGLGSNVVQAVPCPRVRRDRTFSSALSLKQWLAEHGRTVHAVHLITAGAHARRSRLLFEKALGKEVAVGVTSVGSLDYDSRRWWRSSAGVREVVGEAIAYLYARFFFWPAGEAELHKPISSNTRK
jgi:uncharacterized SAM-binding protein YcdF (DUF218 family)